MAGLYIHIPFCASRCGYCDFYSTTSLAGRDRYVDALAREMEAEYGFLSDGSLNTIYIGGGTPSLLTPAQLGHIFDAAARLWDLEGLQEVTLEANPDDLSPEYLAALARLPFDRLSLGVQSFDDGLLKLMNRRHTAAQAAEAIENARRAGFDNLSADLIYGIPGMTPRQWADSVERLIALHPEHISAYCLTIEPGTPFARNGMRPVQEEVAEEQYTLLCDRLSAAGYEHYEISNFALPGRRARHNSAYWSGQAYLGVGASAHSYDGRTVRRWNAQSLQEYIQNAEYQSETLSADDLYNEYIMTALRTSDGVSLAQIEARFGPRRAQDFQSRAAKFIAAGILLCEGKRYFIPSSKMLVSDDVICSLFV